MGRLVRSRLKAGINMRRDSYFLVVSCTSLLLYAICLYTFLHLNGYIGVKAPSSSSSAGESAAQAAAAPYLKSQAQFDDGKIHEFQRNVGHPVDWEMRVKGKKKYYRIFFFDLGHAPGRSVRVYCSVLYSLSGRQKPETLKEKDKNTLAKFNLDPMGSQSIKQDGHISASPP